MMMIFRMKFPCGEFRYAKFICVEIYTAPRGFLTTARPAIRREVIVDWLFAFRPTGNTYCSCSCFFHATMLFETNSYVTRICIDFSKALDTVNHNILLALPPTTLFFNAVRKSAGSVYSQTNVPCIIVIRSFVLTWHIQGGPTNECPVHYRDSLIRSHLAYTVLYSCTFR